MSGQTVIRITEQEIEIDTIVKEFTNRSTGAMAIFTGIVRGETHQKDPHETIELIYEAYSQMAEKLMHRIADEIRNQWPLVQSIAIIQRIGIINPGIPSVLIVCTGEHRDSGIFEAAKYGIERLKQVVPIWKKEISPEGSKWVEGDHRPGDLSK